MIGVLCAGVTDISKCLAINREQVPTRRFSFRRLQVLTSYTMVHRVTCLQPLHISLMVPGRIISQQWPIMVGSKMNRTSFKPVGMWVNSQRDCVYLVLTKWSVLAYNAPEDHGQVLGGGAPTPEIILT